MTFCCADDNIIVFYLIIVGRFRDDRIDSDYVGRVTRVAGLMKFAGKRRTYVYDKRKCWTYVPVHTYLPITRSPSEVDTRLSGDDHGHVFVRGRSARTRYSVYIFTAAGPFPLTPRVWQIFLLPVLYRVRVRSSSPSVTELSRPATLLCARPG